MLIFGSPPFKGLPDFDIKTFIWNGLLDKLTIGTVDFILYILLLIAVIAIPAVTIYLLFKFTYVKDIFRFSRDYLLRPTRASYAELLPNYFLINILVSFVVYLSIMCFAGGYFVELRVYPLSPGNLIGGLDADFDFLTFNIHESDIGDQILIGTVTWFTWVFIFPLIYSLLLGERKWGNIYKNAMFISSIAIFLLLIGSIFGGTTYLEAIGLHPGEAIFADESLHLTYQLAVQIPLNIFLVIFLLFLGIGVNRITPSKTRIPSLFAIAVSIYLTLIVQRLFFFSWAAPS